MDTHTGIRLRKPPHGSRSRLTYRNLKPWELRLSSVFGTMRREVAKSTHDAIATLHLSAYAGTFPTVVGIERVVVVRVALPMLVCGHTPPQ